MGMVIRVLYNNKAWQTPCKQPGIDSLCWQCFEENSNLQIRHPKRTDEICSGHCWERYLCKNFEWGCTPKYHKFGNEAYKGIEVFFVFQQPGRKYTLWGRTIVDSVNVSAKRQLGSDEKGFDYWIHFKPFEPLSRDKWVRDLRDIDIVGTIWKMGRYRFITASQEDALRKRIAGLSPETLKKYETSAPPINNRILDVSVSSKMYEGLELASNEDGRQIDELIREALAKWLKDRGK